VESGVQWENEIQRLFELVLTTDDLSTFQRLAVEVQHTLYLRIEQLQRESALATAADPKDSSIFESGSSNLSSGVPLSESTEEP
jgi:hypothetical protein